MRTRSDDEFQHTAQEGLLWAVEQGGGTASAALMTSETRSRNASAKTMASEKMRCRSQAQIPAHTPPVGAGWTSQMRFMVAWSSPKTAVAPMNSVTSPMMVASAPCGLVVVRMVVMRSRPAVPHEAFKLRCKLMGHLLPIEHEPDHAHDEEHQWRQGQGV